MTKEKHLVKQDQKIILKKGDCEIAAMIGWWRCGVSFFDIGNMVNLHPEYIERIVKDHIKKNPQ